MSSASASRVRLRAVNALRKLCDGALKPPNGIVSSQASISSAGWRACLGPCAAMTPISVQRPRSPLSSCVRCETNISGVLDASTPPGSPATARVQTASKAHRKAVIINIRVPAAIPTVRLTYAP
jgi:hypothetical protein